MNILIRILHAFIMTLCLACFQGCMGKNNLVFHSDFKTMTHIAVFPVIPMDGGSVWSETKSPQGKTHIENQKEAAYLMTDHLIERLKSMPSLTVTPLPDITGKDVVDMQEGRFTFELPAETDSFVLCRLYCFRDRHGGDYSVQAPSRVAFDFRVVRASDGESLFFSEYDETQKSLLENILGIGLFVKRKGRWISAREMAETALDEILDGWEQQ